MAVFRETGPFSFGQKQRLLLFRIRHSLFVISPEHSLGVCARTGVASVFSFQRSVDWLYYITICRDTVMSHRCNARHERSTMVWKTPLLTKERWHPDAFYRDDGVVLKRRSGIQLGWRPESGARWIFIIVREPPRQRPKDGHCHPSLVRRGIW